MNTFETSGILELCVLDTKHDEKILYGNYCDKQITHLKNCKKVRLGIEKWRSVKKKI